MKILVTGGIKSGKSVFAEKKTLELSKGKIPVYLATAERNDREMERKIEKHCKKEEGDKRKTVLEGFRSVTELMENN